MECAIRGRYASYPSGCDVPRTSLSSPRRASFHWRGAFGGLEWDLARATVIVLRQFTSARLPQAVICRWSAFGRKDRMLGQDRRELAAVFIGGAAGTLARAAAAALAASDPSRWPWPTFAVNMIGTFLLGYFTTRLLERLPLSSYRRPLLGTGLCGGLTTFSTMQVETLRMVEHHYYGLALGYTVASVIGGLLAVYIATVMVRRVRGRR